MQRRSSASRLISILLVPFLVAGEVCATAQQKPVIGAKKASDPQQTRSTPDEDKKALASSPAKASEDDKKSVGDGAAATFKDIDVMDIEDLQEMSLVEIRKIAITRDFKSMSDLHKEVTKAVYSARLGVDVEFDAGASVFVLADKFKTKDAAMEVMLNIAEPNAVHFSGVLADPNSNVEKDKGGYRVVLRNEFRTIVPGDAERARIAVVIEADRFGSKPTARDAKKPQLTDVLDPKKKTPYLTEKQFAQVSELVRQYLPNNADPDFATHEGCLAFRKALREAATAQKATMQKHKPQSLQSPDQAFRTAQETTGFLKAAEKALDGLEDMRRRQRIVEKASAAPAKN